MKRAVACFITSCIALSLPGLPCAADKSQGALATGTLLSRPFKPEKINYNSGILVFRAGVRLSGGASAERLAITFNGDENLPGKTISVSAGVVQGAQNKTWSVTRTISGAGGTSLSKNGYEDYELRIRFYKPVNGYLPGYIELNIPAEKTILKGYFYAEKGADNQVFL